MNKGNRKYDAISLLVMLITLMMLVLAGNILIVNSKVIIAKAEAQISTQGNKMNDTKDSLFLHVINKSMCMLEINYKENGGKDTASLIKDFFNKTVDVNYKNPKSLIKAQISMIKDVESNIESKVATTLETEDNDTSEIYIAKPSYVNNSQPIMNDGENPYEDDIEVINEDNTNQENDNSNNKANNQKKQGLTSEIEIVSTPVPSPIKIVHSLEDPLIFVYHTHGTESYRPESVGNYHSLNRKYTVIKVGEDITNYLENSGFKVVHDDTIHDYPSYQGSYTRSLETLSKNLKSDPALKVVFDIHRDGIDKVDELNTKEYEGIRKRSYVEINGEKVARFAIVLGGGNDNIEELKEFAYYIKAVSDELYPGLARPIILKKFKYNQYKSDYYALLEIGNNTNTIEEARRTSKYIGEVINQVLRKCIVSP
ncbi:stage II sporulation protein P [Wukongibacter sp. M2B1]|uniref:stage II sporulation protein P n=1 Tax=Wukongibacter sp. M2B1 TaxID=3088895 RepID=UPI003D7B7DE1